MDDVLDNLLYALKCTAEVATRRNNALALAACERLSLRLKNGILDQADPDVTIRDVCRRTRWLIADLRSAIKFEMREILIPFIEVKEPTHEFGLQMFPDYFQWLSGDERYTAGDLLKILEEDTTKLLIAEEHVQKSEVMEAQQRGKNA